MRPQENRGSIGRARIDALHRQMQRIVAAPLQLAMHLSDTAQGPAGNDTR